MQEGKQQPRGLREDIQQIELNISDLDYTLNLASQRHTKHYGEFFTMRDDLEQIKFRLSRIKEKE